MVSSAATYIPLSVPGFTFARNWFGRGFREHLTAVGDLFRFRLQPDANFFDEEDQIGDFFGAHRGGSKFLDRFSVSEMTSLVSGSRLGQGLLARGIDDWYIEFDLRDCFVHYCYMRRRCLPHADQYIGFLIVQLGRFAIGRDDSGSPGFAVMQPILSSDLNLLNARWLSLQDPLGEFSVRRQRLPGQRFPGTGLGRFAYDTLVAEAVRCGREGIVNVPEHFHNAMMYKKFQFLNPDYEGWFRKLQRDLARDIEERGLAQVSWAIYLGFLTCDEAPVVWEAREQVLAISGRLKAYFKSSAYRAAADRRMRSVGQFAVRWDEAESYCLAAILAAKEPCDE